MGKSTARKDIILDLRVDEKLGFSTSIVDAIVPEGETQRYKVRKNSIYQTKSELL